MTHRQHVYPHQHRGSAKRVGPVLIAVSLLLAVPAAMSIQGLLPSWAGIASVIAGLPLFAVGTLTTWLERAS